MTSLATRTEQAPPIKCTAAGVLCQVLGYFEREAAGRAGLCCRHYLEEPPVTFISDAVYDEGDGQPGVDR